VAIRMVRIARGENVEREHKIEHVE
jgi:hypothetical protein